MYLVDTNVLVLAIDQKEPEYSFLQKVILKNQLYLSVICIGEYLSKATVDAEQEIAKLIKTFPVLEIDLETAKLAAAYRKESLKTKRVQMLDCFLAAQAKVNKLTLVTNNKSDFPMKDVKIISP